MIGRRFAPWLLVLGLVACGPDGGTSGTGITGGTSGTGTISRDIETVVEGFVGSLREARGPKPRETSTWLAALGRWLEPVPEAVAQGGIGGLRVRIDGTSVEGATDADGFFALSGSFGENVTLVFEDASGQARLPATIPSGGRLTLDEVTVDFVSGEASSAHQGVRFDAIVQDPQCLRERLTVASRFAPEGPSYVVHTDGASLQVNGEAVDCRSLSPGDAIVVEGPIESDGTVGTTDARTDQAIRSVGL